MTAAIRRGNEAYNSSCNFAYNNAFQYCVLTKVFILELTEEKTS